MTDTNVFPLARPGSFADPLTDVLRNGARPLLRASRRGRGCRLAQLPHREANRRRAPAAGTPRASARTGDYDGHRSGPFPLQIAQPIIPHLADRLPSAILR